MSALRIDHGVTSGTFSLDGETHEVDNNVWVIGNDDECIVIDAPHSVDDILRVIDGRRVLAIVCTHAHDDHVRVAPALAEAVEAPILLHPDDRVVWNLTHPEVEPDGPLADGQTIIVGGTPLEVLHTPGHAPGAVCLYVPSLGAVFSGDTLFQGGPGATGRSFSDYDTIVASIRSRLFALPDDTVVHTGHGAPPRSAPRPTRWVVERRPRGDERASSPRGRSALDLTRSLYWAGASRGSGVKRRVTCLAAMGLASALLAGCTGGGEPDPDDAAAAAAQPVIEDFVAAWNADEPPPLEGIVDTPMLAAADMRQFADGLDLTSTTVEPLGQPDCSDDACEQRARVTQQIAGYGAWQYPTRIVAEPLERPDGEPGPWRVTWSPAVLNPDLSRATTLEAVRMMPRRASILDREGMALTPERDIVRIGVRPDEVRPRTYLRLTELLEINGPDLKTRVQAAEPDWFVSVIDLRASQYDPLRQKLLRVPGIVIDPGTRALAPSASWARGVVGVVAPATAESLKNAAPHALPTDEVGESGLQYAYERQLAGKPGIRIELVENRPNGPVLNTVLRRAPEPGVGVRTSLDFDVQTAAEAAVSTAPTESSIVVVKASTGEVLAAANGPETTSYNSAFVGQYAPGSTFKVVSAAALMRETDLTPATPVTCPDTTVVNGKSFKNYDPGITDGTVAFGKAFAESCNTTFVDAADEITGEQLSDAATLFGFGEPWDLGIDAFSGSVPAESDPVTRAAQMIGQGTVQASPLGMAMVAAGVSSGVVRTPTLLPDEAPGQRLGTLPNQLRQDLAEMMRQTVTEGTASSLDLPGSPVHAKTGTAEYALPGGGTGTNAWLIGYRGDLAFAVFVSDADSGGTDAGELARALLTDIPKEYAE